mgnify:CR=1 FL=1
MDPWILVIDDEAVTREALAAILRQAGYGVEAWEDARPLEGRGLNRPYRLAVVDYHLPTVTGLEAAIRLKRHLPGCRVLLISSEPPPRDDAAWELGVVDGFLAKPFSKDAILEAVGRLLTPASW